MTLKVRTAFLLSRERRSDDDVAAMQKLHGKGRVCVMDKFRAIACTCSIISYLVLEIFVKKNGI